MNDSSNDKISRVFRAYDVRGLFPDELNKEGAFKIGKAFASTFAAGSNVAVARDVRSSSKAIHRALCDGITSQGINVIDVGKVPSPVLYFTTRNLGLAAGAMVTASHLPPNWNGIKFCDNRGIVISEGTGLESIRQAAISSNINTGKNTRKEGKVHIYKEVIQDYTKYVIKKVHIGRKLSVVVDYGNSVTANIVPSILTELGIKFKQINIEQGNFMRSSELTDNSMGELRKEVFDSGSDLGIAYDADGDRVGFVDNLGNVYPTGEKIIPIFAVSALSKSNGEIVIDVTCPSSISEFIRKIGGAPVTIRVGTSYCANEVLKRNALFGAQYSGHYSFPEMGGSDDAIFASLKMIEILSNSEIDLHQLVTSLPASYTSGIIEVDCLDSEKFSIILTVASKAKNMGYRLDEIDGVKIYSANNDNEWVLIRASNTSPIIRINADGNSMDSAEKLLSFGVNMVKGVINNH